MSMTVQAPKRREIVSTRVIRGWRQWQAHRPVSSQTLADFFDRLATLLASGISLLQALEFARSTTRHPKLNESILDVSNRVRGGAQLSEGFVGHRDVFDASVIGMIRAGEASGRLEEVLRELSRIFAARAQIRSRFFQALAYPALVASLGLMTIVVLLVFVIPKITAVFELWEAQLPLITRILMAVSAFFSHGGFLILVLPVAVYFVIRSKSHQKRRIWTWKLMEALPWVSSVVFLGDFIQLLRTWGMLLRNGVPVIESLSSVRDVLWSPRIQKGLDQIKEQVIRGASLHEAVMTQSWFPDLAAASLAVGEETGTLDESLEKAAVFYEREWNIKMRMMSTLIEPLLILAIGLVVGLLVVALLLPIFELSLIIQ